MEYLLKMLFFANIASNLKVESMHFAHRNCEYILGVIYLFVFPVFYHKYTSKNSDSLLFCVLHVQNKDEKSWHFKIIFG